MNKNMGKSFFNNSVTEICHKLLGKFLIRKTNNQEKSFLITEIEAYDGPKDLACHARFGKTKRNEAMFSVINVPLLRILNLIRLRTIPVKSSTKSSRQNGSPPEMVTVVTAHRFNSSKNSSHSFVGISFATSLALV